MSKAKKGWIIAASVVGGILILLMLAVGTIMLAEPLFFKDFYNDSRKEFDTPGMSDGFVQQGLAYADGVFLTCGYMSDGKTPSRIYITEGDDFSSRKSRYVEIADEQGNGITPHAGGLSVYGDFVYLCNSEGEPSQMIVYSLHDILTEQDGKVSAVGRFAVDNNASFCHIEGDTLYVGEFFMEGKYPTKPSHEMTAPNGEKHRATIFCYDLQQGKNDTFGLKDFQADLVYSVMDKAQGMCFYDGNIVISSSYGVATSRNCFYSVPTEAEGTFSVDGVNIPLKYLDGDNLVKDCALPPMAEELVCVGDRIFVMNESACNKYFFGRLLRAKYIWSYKPDLT